MKTKNGYDHWDLLNALSLYIHQQFLTYFGQPKLDLNYIKNRYLRDILSLGYYNQRNQTPGIGNKHAHLPGMMPESIIINFVCICFAVHVCKVVGREGGGSIDSEGHTMAFKVGYWGRSWDINRQISMYFVGCQKLLTYHALLSLLSLSHFV